MEHDYISMYAMLAVSVLVCPTLYDADRWNPGSDKRKTKNLVLLPICSMMHTMILTTADQGMAVGVSETTGFCLM